MKPLLLLVVVATVGIACTDEGRSDPNTAPRGEAAQASDSDTVPSAAPTPDAPSRTADIYAAVIRQLWSDTNLGRYEAIYVVDGEIAGAGKPRGNPFAPPLQAFGQDVVAALQKQVAGKPPPLRFVDDGKEALRNPDRPGLVKHRGALIALGPIEAAGDRFHVRNTVWCGGKCSQWRTYVLARRDGRWTITGATGAAVDS